MADPLPDWLRRQDDEARAFELDAEQASTRPARRLLADFTRRLAAAYIRVAGSLGAPIPERSRDGFRQVVAELVRRLAQALARLFGGFGVQDTIAAGLALGVQHAAAVVGAVRLRPRPSRQLAAATARIGSAAAAAIAAAVAAATVLPVDTWSQVTALAAVTHRPVNVAEAGVRWAANASIAEGTTAVAEDAEVPRLWIAERDACLTCLAYAGEIAQPGEPFPAGRTFGDKSTVTEPILGPPGHPNCRCRITLWLGNRQPFGVDLPNALKREAERSVLRGMTGYASEPARVRAADRLLKTGTSGLPESVKKRARAAVALGRMTPP